MTDAETVAASAAQWLKDGMGDGNASHYAVYEDHKLAGALSYMGYTALEDGNFTAEERVAILEEIRRLVALDH